jgi:hypothetical protein
MDVGGWLRSLGLEEYEAAFRENKVDAAVLPKLTAEDLKDLGIAAVGIAASCPKLSLLCVATRMLRGLPVTRWPLLAPRPRLPKTGPSAVK